MQQDKEKEPQRHPNATHIGPDDARQAALKDFRKSVGGERSSRGRKADSGVYTGRNSDTDADTDQEDLPMPRRLQPMLDVNVDVGHVFPALDEDVANVLQPKRPTLMSIFLNQKWEGAAVSYGDQNESYISDRLARRFSVEMVDKKIFATWTFDAKLGKTHHTEFHVIPDDDHDIILGKMSEDEEFNRCQVASSSTKPAATNGM